MAYTDSNKMGWVRGKSLNGWDEAEKAKVRHMLKQGKSPETVSAYMGMQLEHVQSIQRKLEREGGFKYGWMKDAAPIGHTERPEGPTFGQLLKSNAEYVKRVKAVAA